MQGWTGWSALFTLLCAGETSALHNAFSSSSMTPMLRFFVDLTGGLSSGVNGIDEPCEGLGEWLRARKETVDELLLLVPAATA